jgi:hypothetical protein
MEMFDFMEIAGLEGITDDFGTQADSFSIQAQDFGYDGNIVGMDSGGGMESYYIDVDGDFIPDVAIHIEQHGDVTFIGKDFGADGSIEQITRLSENDEGNIDFHTVTVSNDALTIHEVTGVMDTDGNLLEIVSMQESFADDFFQYTVEIPGTQHFDPNNFDPDSIIGDPAGAIDVFYPQSVDGPCAAVAQGFVIQQLTGEVMTEADLSAMSEAYEWYAPGGGTYPHNVGNIMLEHGLTVARGTDYTIDDIADVLENGGGVVVGVRAADLYPGDWYSPGMGADHAIQVIGIDNSNPDFPMVILNDSGIQHGGGIMIPLDSFLNAWEASGNFMVSAYA